MSLRSPHSLRARLLWFLLAAILLTAIVQATIAYRTARDDADGIFDYQMQQMAMSLRSGLPLSRPEAAGEDATDDENFDFVVQVWTADGRSVFQSAARAALPRDTALGFANVSAHGTTYRVYSMRSHAQTIQVAQDIAVRRETASTLALRMVAPIAVMAPLLMVLVWWVVSASVAPVSRVRRQVAERQADDLTEVSEAGLPDEIRPLVHELNLLFTRVRLAFEAQRSFVADAAHELRSPLAALKLQVQGLQRAGSDAAREVAVARLTAGIDRATRLVEQLLVLARQQASAATGAKPEPVSLADVSRLAVADAAPLAQARQIDLGLVHSDEGRISGHADALRILVRNLLDNAVKYTPAGGTVDLEVRRLDGALALSVDDSGPGIAEDDRERVLDRFYRIAGTPTTGSGLGLAIVKSITELHGATLQLGHSQRLGGLRVEVRFPSGP
ncbi:MAG: two-component sensor histidine kinase [Burkholderiales bacterium]|nr:two-component sensor histidine kinase [Burkholderiales bacterium]